MSRFLANRSPWISNFTTGLWWGEELVCHFKYAWAVIGCRFMPATGSRGWRFFGLVAAWARRWLRSESDRNTAGGRRDGVCLLGNCTQDWSSTLRRWPKDHTHTHTLSPAVVLCLLDTDCSQSPSNECWFFHACLWNQLVLSEIKVPKAVFAL